MAEPWLNALLLVLIAAVAAAACLLARRLLRATPVHHGSWSATLSYVATSYGILVGFSIIFLFGEFSDARQAVGDEATAIGTAYEQASLFPGSAPEIQRALVCYARAVPAYDWPALRDHGGAAEVDTAFHDLVVSVGEGDRPPVGALHSGTATSLTAQIANISTARETRLVAAETTVPPLLWVLLVGGGGFVITLIFVVTMSARPATQAVLVSVSTVFTSFMLLLVLALSEPFGGGGGRISPHLIEDTLTTMESSASGAVTRACQP